MRKYILIEIDGDDPHIRPRQLTLDGVVDYLKDRCDFANMDPHGDELVFIDKVSTLLLRLSFKDCTHVLEWDHLRFLVSEILP